MRKYLLNQRVKLIAAYNCSEAKVGEVGYIAKVDETDHLLTYKIILDGRSPDWEWVREQDIEPEKGIVAGKTLAQVVAEVAALDAQEAAANTTLASIAEHREKLRVELAGFGLALTAQSAPIVATKTMYELYHADDIKRGDVFTFIGPRDHNRSWVVGQNYMVSRVDSDESVLMAELHDSEDQDWAWKNEGTFDKFVKAA